MNTQTQDPTQIIKLLHITDPHLGGVPGERLMGLDTDESLRDVLQLMQPTARQAHHLVATGDISGGGDTTSYQRFLKILSQYTSLPISWLPGNHDSAAAMAAVDALAREPIVELGNWLLILLNTGDPGKIPGYLAPSELAILERSLTQYPNRPTLVFLHHHPVPLGSEWLDGTMLRNADALFAILGQHDQVKALSWGHVHQEYSGEWKGIKLFATPSTCIQFAPGEADFTLDHNMPGFRWYHLHPDGHLETDVQRVAKKSYGIDFSSGGY